MFLMFFAMSPVRGRISSVTCAHSISNSYLRGAEGSRLRSSSIQSNCMPLGLVARHGSAVDRAA